MTESNFKRNPDLTLAISNNSKMPGMKLFGKLDDRMQEEKPLFQQIQTSQNEENTLFGFGTQSNPVQRPQQVGPSGFGFGEQGNQFSMGFLSQPSKQTKLSKHSKKKKWLKRI